MVKATEAKMKEKKRELRMCLHRTIELFNFFEMEIF